MNNIILNEIERTKILMGLDIKEKKVINEQLFPFLRKGIDDLVGKIVTADVRGKVTQYFINGQLVDKKIADLFTDIFKQTKKFDNLSVADQKLFLKYFYFWVKANPEQVVRFMDDVYADIFRKFESIKQGLSEFELLGSIRFNMKNSGEDLKTILKDLFPDADDETLEMMEIAFKKRLDEYDDAFKKGTQMRKLEGDNGDIIQVKSQKSGGGTLSDAEIKSFAIKLKNRGTIWKTLWDTLSPIYKKELDIFKKQCDEAVLGYRKSIENAINNTNPEKIGEVIEQINSAYIMKITELMKAMNARKTGAAKEALEDLAKKDPYLAEIINKSDSKQLEELNEIMDANLGYGTMLKSELIEIARNTKDILSSFFKIFYQPKTVINFIKRSDIATFLLTGQWLTFKRMFYLASKYSLSESKFKAFLTYTIASIGITVMGQVSASLISVVSDLFIESFWNKLFNNLFLAYLGDLIGKNLSRPVDTFLSDEKKELESENETGDIIMESVMEFLERFGGTTYEFIKKDMGNEAAFVTLWRLIPAGGLQSYDESIVSKTIETFVGNERLEIKPLPFELAGLFGWDLKTVEQENNIIDQQNKDAEAKKKKKEEADAATQQAKDKFNKQINKKINQIITNINSKLYSSTGESLTSVQEEILKKNIKYTGPLDEFDENSFVIKINGKDYKYSWGGSLGVLFNGDPIAPTGKKSKMIPILFSIKEHREKNEIINKIKRIILQEEEEKTLKMKDWDEIFTFQKIDDKNPGKYTDVKIKMDTVMDRMPHWRKKYNKQCEELENCDDDGEDDSFVRAVIDTHPDVVRILYTKGLANLTSSDDQEDLNEGFHSLLRVIREAKNVEVEVWSVYRHPSSPDKIWSLVKGDYKPKELSSMDMKMQQSPQNKIEKKKDSLGELKKKELDAIKTLSLDEKKGLQELPIKVRDKVKEKIKRGWTTEKPSHDLIDFFKLDNVDSVFDEKIKIYKLKPNTDFFKHLDKKTFDVNIKRGFCRALYYVEKELDLSKEKLFKVEEILSKCENKFDGKYGQNYL